MIYIFISLIAIGLMYGIYYSGKPSNEVSAQIKMGCAEYAMKAATDQGSKQMYEACIELYENK
jgi:hypothetical protein